MDEETRHPGVVPTAPEPLPGPGVRRDPPAVEIDPILDTEVDTDAVWTVPNVLSLLRLAGAPVVLWLILGPRFDLLAVGVLALAGVTDWLDGRLARAWRQRSRVGRWLDPMADRTYIFAVVLALALREIIPWWLVAILVARDLLMAGLLRPLRSRGYFVLPSHFLGKVATFALLYAFPLVLLGSGTEPYAILARVVGWAFALWGTALYWWSGLLYLRQAQHLLRRTRPLRELQAQP
ncbi:MAG: CDP-alcohol phosphatidyltransferase family protein [Propionibacteriaceae bacterium]